MINKLSNVEISKIIKGLNVVDKVSLISIEQVILQSYFLTGMR